MDLYLNLFYLASGQHLSGCVSSIRPTIPGRNPQFPTQR
jgi:hypothetical protein